MPMKSTIGITDFKALIAEGKSVWSVAIFQLFVLSVITKL
jgi:hypothetical protein